MQIYKVGGAVRDQLLGIPVHDRDWLVVGASPQQMLAQGFLPVGKDFPVFLHPQTHEEYALARTERKSGHGYKGFAVYAAPDVTLEQDLARRDLTINAMAICTDAQGQEVLHDPYRGQQDLQDRVLRHVTGAFREDPVRILRVARFAARFDGFSVAAETMLLMQEMVQAGEVDHLVPERVWQELARGLMEARPSRMVEVLRACGALKVLLPELDCLWGVAQRADYHPEVDAGIHTMLVLDMAAQLDAPLAVRYAALLHDLGKGNTPAEVLPRHTGHEQRSHLLEAEVSQRLKVPADVHSLASLVALEHANIHRSLETDAEAIVQLLERCDAFRRPERFALALWACECDVRGRLGWQDKSYPQRPLLQAALQQAQGIDTAHVAASAARQGLRGEQIGQQIHAARVAAVGQWQAGSGAQ